MIMFIVRAEMIDSTQTRPQEGAIILKKHHEHWNYYSNFLEYAQFHILKMS